MKYAILETNQLPLWVILWRRRWEERRGEWMFAWIVGGKDRIMNGIIEFGRIN